MADFSVPAVTDLGALQSAFPLAQSQIAANTAGAQLTQAQAQGALIGNQQSQIQLQLLKQGLSNLQNFSGQAPQQADQSGTDPNDLSVFQGDAGLDAGLRQRFWVSPLGTPAERQGIVAAHLSGNAGLAAAMTAQRDMNVGQRVNAAQLQSSNMFDAMQAVQTAPPGMAMRTLEAVMPHGATLVQQEIDEGVDPDEAARDTAAHVAAQVHQYTGRPIEADAGGQYRDTKTGQPIANTVVGMNAQQTAALRGEAVKLVSVPQSDGSTKQEPTWQAQHFANANQWVTTMASRLVATQSLPATGAPAAPGAAQGVAPSAPAPGNPAVPSPTTAGQTPGAAPTAANVQPPGAPPTAPAVNPVLKAALTDPSFKLKAPPVQSGVTPTPAQLDQQKQTVTARTSLLQDSQDATSAAAQSLQYMQAAKNILDSKGASVGAYGGLIAKASNLLPGQSVDASNYAEVAKYLGNAALAQAKGIYGARMTQSEVGLQLNELSPSTKMPASAINNLLAANIRSAQYTIASSQRARQYLATGGDPQQFSEWNQQYFPREQAVNAPAASAAPPKANAGTPTAAPPPAAARPDASGFIAGRLYPGANGTRARYMGMGKWQQQ